MGPCRWSNLSIAWCSGKADVALTIHDGDSGRLLRHSNLKRHLCPTSHLGYRWSPSGRGVVAYGWGCQRDSNGIIAPQPQLGVMVIGSDGDGFRIAVGPGSPAPGQFLCVGWSPCGRYLHLPSQGPKHGQGPEFFHTGCVWDVIQKSRVICWDETCDPHGSSTHVIWPAKTKQSTQRTTCIVTGHKNIGTLLLLPSLQGSGAAESRSMYPLYEVDVRGPAWPSHAISPCGQLLVFGSLHRHSRDVHGSSKTVTLHPLCHEEVMGVNARIKREVAISFCRWWLGSIAWHPCPASKRLYAIADENGTVYLIDGCHHKQLRSWSWQELSFKDGQNIHLSYWRFQLHWSPCGSQLVVCAPGLTTFLCFD